MKRIPWLLIYFRIGLAPVALAGSILLHEEAGKLLFILLLSGVLSDIFDGIIARKAGVSTERLRKLDSNADLFFLLGMLTATYIALPYQVLEKKEALLGLMLLEALTYAISYLRFKKAPANHAYFSKFFALTILLSLSVLYLDGSWGWPFHLMFCTGVLSYLDNFMILLLLPAYRVDTKSFLSAWKLRKRFLAGN